MLHFSNRSPRQNHLTDIFSLLCFLHVQPWCMYSYWQDNIQAPFEEDEEKGVAILQVGWEEKLGVFCTP